MAETLIVDQIHMYEKENAKAHHTLNYQLIHEKSPTPVLRRGQAFNILLRLNRKFNEKTDIVKLTFKFGKKPEKSEETKVVVFASRTIDSNKFSWKVQIKRVEGKDLILEIKSLAHSPVGSWKFDVETFVKNDRHSHNIKSFDGFFYLLFNPWVKEDQVYMERQDLLNEYVLNDVGKIWVGELANRQWIFEQFEAKILPICELLLKKSQIEDPLRGNPILVSRMISKMVNSADEDGGVLLGAWLPHTYEGGRNPLEWVGSLEILEEYFETEQPVKYGQCWVFSGIVTTICRALGIPCRPVTNINSAHDADCSLSVDEYRDENDMKIDTQDSVWNFHVWNDVWFARPDIHQDYGGWQAIDATPQEKPDQKCVCGPASVRAIKEGVIGHPYDTAFILASINADVFSWKQDSTNEWKKTDTRMSQIGKAILTKAPFVFDSRGYKDIENITHLYKAPEGSREERLSLRKAVLNSSKQAQKFHSIRVDDVKELHFELHDIKNVNFGEPFSVIVSIENKSDSHRNIKAKLSAQSVSYTGFDAHVLNSAEKKISIKPHQSEKFRLPVNVEHYSNKLLDFNHVKIHAITTTIETNQTWTGESYIQFIKPEIDIVVNGEPTVRKQSTIILSFKNPLKKTLNNCSFNLRFSKRMPGDLEQNIEFRKIGPEEYIELKTVIVPIRPGHQSIIAKFDSNELPGIIGSARLQVSDENEY